MATPPALTQFAFAAGLDESQQDEVLDPLSAFPVLQNVRQDRRGGASKRLGFGNLPAARLDGTTRSAGRCLFAHYGAPCTIDSVKLDTYSEDAGASVVRCRVPEPSCAVRPAWQPGMRMTVSDSVGVGNYTAISYHGDDGSNDYVFVALLDASGARLSTFVAFASSLGYIPLASYGAYVIAFVLDKGANTIVAHYLDTTSRATIDAGWSVAGTIANDYQDHNGVDTGSVAVASLETGAAIAYTNTSAGASQLSVKVLTIAGVASSTTVNTTSTFPLAVDIAGSIADTLWVAWAEGRPCKVIGLSASGGLSVACTTATVVDTSAVDNTPNTTPFALYVCPSGDTNGAAALAVCSHRATSPDALFLYARAFRASAATTPDGTTVITYNATFRGRPFAIGDRYYAPASSEAERAHWYIGTNVAGDNVAFVDWTPERYSGVYDSAAYLFTPLRPVAAPVERGLFAGTTTDQSRCSIRGSRVTYACAIDASNAAERVALITLDFAARRWATAPHAGATWVSGGMLASFDGDTLFESSFLFVSRRPTVTFGGTGQTTTVGWTYVVVYEHVDAAGSWHVSGVSPPINTGAFTNDSVTVTASPLSITARMTRDVMSAPIRAALYRTEDGGSVFHRVMTAQNYAGAALVFDPDDMSDATLVAQHKLYGTGVLPGAYGGAQDRRHCPNASHVVSCNGALVVASTNTLRVSSQFVSGEGLWFSPAFQVDVLDSEDITALATIDGVVYAFKAGSIHAVSVEPPSDNGGIGGLGVPRRLTADVGCIDPSSVAVTSAGVFFRSHRGIELLSRSGAVTPIGEQVQRTLAAYPVITSAVLDDVHGLVRFTLAERADDGGGRTLVYDLTLNVWISVDDVHGSSAREAARSAAMVTVGGERRYAWLGADGIVHVERLATDADAHLDGSSWVTMAAEVAWIKAAGIQGQQHVNHALVLARKASDHNLSVSLAYNYETSFRTPRMWTRAEINALLTAGWPVTQLKHEPHDDAECQSVRLRLEDSEPTGGTVGTGKGATWIALTLDITPKPGVFDVPGEAA